MASSAFCCGITPHPDDQGSGRMILPLLTVRNLTSTCTELRLIERYDPPSGHHNPFNLTVATRTSTTALKNHELISKSQSFTVEEANVLIGPFETVTTKIQPKAHETLRLTFETESQRYRIDTPCPASRSTVLTPLSPNPSHEYTAVFSPKHSFLALYSSAHLESWMYELKDITPLSALSLPGTHNSHTYHVALPSVRCQAVPVQDQLKNGIRFLDIRVQPQYPEDPSKDQLLLVHGAFPNSLAGNKHLRHLTNDMLAFLRAHPSETVLLSLKREGIGRSTDEQLSMILHNHYATDPSRWFTENRIPTLGEARGKICLVRRFKLDDSLKSHNNGTGWCIDAESWPDNCEDGITSSGELRVQDFYEVEETVNIDKKIRLVEAHLARAAAGVAVLPQEPAVALVEAAKSPVYINFLSASNFFRPGCWPERIAARVTPAIIDYLCRQHNEPMDENGSTTRVVGDGATGIVVCDWVGLYGNWDIIRCVVGMNSKLEMRENGIRQ